jgi:AcrR family transcriptional regulator
MVSFTQATLSGIPGVRAISQDRSLKAVLRLIDVAEPLMRAKGFDAVAVEEFTTMAGVSVGTFYGRFDDKNAFFGAIKAIRLMEYVECARAVAPGLTGPDASLEHCVHEIVSVVVDFSRANRGFIASGVRRGQDRNEWMPHRMAARSVMDIFRVIVGKISAADAADAEARYIFGFQAAYGIVINACLNDPGPILLDDDEIKTEISRILIDYWSKKVKY